MNDSTSIPQGGQQASTNERARAASKQPIDAETVREEARRGAEFERVFLEAAATNMVFDGFNDGEKMRSEQWQRQQEDETIA